jgi:hypothetical protein
MPETNPSSYPDLAALIDANKGKSGSEIAQMAEAAGFTLPSAGGGESMMTEDDGEAGPMDDILADDNPTKGAKSFDDALGKAASANISKFSKGSSSKSEPAE